MSAMDMHLNGAAGRAIRLAVAGAVLLGSLAALPPTFATAGSSPNLVGNPGFEIDTSGWNTAPGWSAGVSLTRVPVSHSGSWGAQLINTGTTATSCILNDSPNWVATTAAGTYVAGIWVKADQAGATLRLKLREYAGTSLAGAAAASLVLSTTWQQLTVSYTPVAPGSSTLDFQAYESNAPPGTCFYADDASISLIPPVVDQPPTVSLTTNPWTGVAPLTLTVDASGSSDTDVTPIASYTFNFGDGSPSLTQAGPIATHTWANPGVYPITVTATDTAGLWGSATVNLTVMLNLVGNPGFESGLSGWNALPSGVAVLQQVSGGHSGAYAAQLSNSGTSGIECVLNDSPNWVKTTASGLYEATLWVRADVAGGLFETKLREYSTTGVLLGSATNSIFLSTSWKVINVFYSAVAPGASTLDFQAYLPNAPSGVCFYADDAAITLS